jgi:cytochrome c biogenesis protein CcdA
MTHELFVAAFIMSVGLCIAGAGTHLYQAVLHEQAMLRYDGKTYLRSMGHVAMSFVCGPYIMLQLGWRQESDGTLSVGSVLLSALVAFGWSFITGLLFLGAYFAVHP